MSKSILQTWKFPSSSGSVDPHTGKVRVYEGILYDDNSTSCNCRGWTFKKEDQERTCRHVRAIQDGTADMMCIAESKLDFAKGVNVATHTPIHQAGEARVRNAFKKHKEVERPKVARRIAWQ